MPLSVKTLTAKRNSLTIEFAGEKVELTYRPGVATPAWESKIQSQENSGYHQLAELVETWDLLDDDGKTPFPLDYKKLLVLPSEFVTSVLVQIAEDMAPNARRFDNSPRRSQASLAE